MKGTFIIGRIASGKSTYASKIKKDNDIIIELGSLVRIIKGENTRFFDNTLDNDIFREVKNIISKYKDENINVILVSARSISLVYMLSTLFSKVEYVFIDTDLEICKERYYTSKRLKDSKLSFEDAIKGDESIGMEKLIEWIKLKYNVRIIHNYNI